MHANGVVSEYEYDALNQLKELTHYAPDATPEDLSDNEILQRYVYDYYQDGNKSRETFTDANGAVHTWDWVYDQLGRLVNEVHDNADDSLDYNTLYKYDLVGNRLEKRTDHGNDGVFEEIIKGTFDRNDRLLNEMRIFNGTPLEKTDYVFNKTEQIAKTVTNLVSSEMESKTTLQYDEQGRLSKIVIDTYANGAHTQSVTQEYFYDSNGIKIRQVEKVDANADGVVDATREITYLNDNQNHTGYSQVLEERLVENGEEVKVTTYTIGHDVLAQFDTVAGYLSLLADGHGSTRAVANATGAIVQQYSYDAYGNAHGFKPSEALTNLLYSGEQFNPVSGLQYLRARWYNPQSGRFNRLDPYSGNQQSPLSYHKYAYAQANPILSKDPTGCFSLPEISMVTAIQTTLFLMNVYSLVNNTYFAASSLIECIVALSKGEVYNTFKYALNTFVFGMSAVLSFIAIGQFLNHLKSITSNIGNLAVAGGSAASVLAVRAITMPATRELALQSLAALFGYTMAMGKGIGNPNASDDDSNRRIKNCEKQESPVWKSLKSYRANTKTDGNGNFYQWDYTHNDIEWYTRNGNKHMGSIHPITGQKYKEAVVGRKITRW